MKILITGGHLSPAIAVIEKLQKISDTEIVYVGRKSSLEGNKEYSREYLQIKARKIRFIPIVTGRLQRSFTKYTLPSLAKIPIGLLQAILIILREKPDCILSFGGYVAVPLVLAGWLKGVKIFTHEQTLTYGLANKIIGHFAQNIFISWPQSKSLYPFKKVILTGNPLREEIFITNNDEIPKDIKNQTDLPLLYITGGSQGSESINNIVIEIIDLLLNKYRVIHQYGQNEKMGNKIKESVKTFTDEKKKRYLPLSFVDEKSIGWVLKEADLVIGRSGANTVSELFALKKRCLLIPLPWAGGNEQTKNAQFLVNAGLGKIIAQSSLSPQLLLNAIESMVHHSKEFPSGKGGKKYSLGVNAGEKIVSFILSEMNRHKHEDISSAKKIS